MILSNCEDEETQVQYERRTRLEWEEKHADDLYEERREREISNGNEEP